MSEGPQGDDDCRKIRFCRDAIAGPDPFKCEPLVDPEIQEIVDWLAGKSAEEVMAYREEAIKQIECLAASIQDAGIRDTWLKGTDCITKQAAPWVFSPPLNLCHVFV